MAGSGFEPPLPFGTSAGGIVHGAPEALPVLVIREPEVPCRAVRLVAVGDVGFGGRPMSFGDPSRLGLLFDEIRGPLSSADLVFGNFEGVLGVPRERGERNDFTAPVECARALSEAGFNVMHLANNHALDQGEEGLGSTVGTLVKNGITTLGVGRGPAEAAAVAHTEVRGLRVGWLATGRTDGLRSDRGWCVNELDPDALVGAAEDAAGRVDCLIVSMHCGYMWVDYPHPDIRRLALRLARAGADLILMHHPHVLQGIEVSPEGAVICYSLGNFMFDWRAGEIRSNVVESLEREGGMFCFELGCDGVLSACLLPIVMDEDCCVRWPDSERAGRILDRVQRISRELETGQWERGFWLQRGERNTLHGMKMLWFLVKRRKFHDLARVLSRLRWHHFVMVGRWLLRRRTAAR